MAIKFVYQYHILYEWLLKAHLTAIKMKYISNSRTALATSYKQSIAVTAAHF